MGEDQLVLLEVKLVLEGLHQLWNFVVVDFPGEQLVLELPCWLASLRAVWKGPLEVLKGL